ncbi:MAG: DNA polymerase III subunit gamma/tau [Clostridia bacterium]|nr:DNA polymerase III subunit gamma/tau [Clostridia bacterium]MBQ4085141.1 DNA polymerase III subunit gamma/tau [Clostridia bacterium]
MAYQALYRQWRPERFADIVGQEQEHIITTLKNQIINGRIAHAYLFCGSRGTGKTTTARVFARAINCLTPEGGCEPCGQCAVCREFLEERSMDLVEIDAASNNGVDEIRDLRDKVKYPPANAKRKVYIIDEVHMLSTGAFNALLKTLEEPPEHAVFLLATTEPNKLPATILSRCQRFDFRRYSAETIVGQLKTVLEGVGAQAEDEALGEIARSAEGGMRDALSLLDMCLSYGENIVSAETVREAIGTSGREFLFTFADHLIRDDAAGALKAIDTLMRDGRDAQAFGREVTGHLRSLLVVQALGESVREASAILECTLEDAQRYIEQGKGVAPDKLIRMMEAFMECESDMKWSSQPRTALELCAFLCCRPAEKLRLDALAERVSKLEQALAKGVRIAAALAGDLPEPPPFDMPGDMDAPPFDMDAPQAAPKKAAAEKKPKKAAIEGADKWEGVAAAIGAANAALKGPLSKVMFAGREGSTVILELAKNDNMFLKMLDNDKKKSMIAEKLSEAFGEPLGVAFRIAGSAGKPKGADPERTETIQQARDIFGRENVDFLD